MKYNLKSVITILAIFSSCATINGKINDGNIFYQFSNDLKGTVPDRSEFISKHEYQKHYNEKLFIGLIKEVGIFSIKLEITPDGITENPIFEFTITSDNGKIILHPYEEMYFDETILKNLLNSGFIVVSSFLKESRYIYILQNKYWKSTYIRDDDIASIYFSQLNNNITTVTLDSLLE